MSNTATKLDVTTIRLMPALWVARTTLSVPSMAGSSISCFGSCTLPVNGEATWMTAFISARIIRQERGLNFLHCTSRTLKSFGQIASYKVFNDDSVEFVAELCVLLSYGLAFGRRSDCSVVHEIGSTIPHSAVSRLTHERHNQLPGLFSPHEWLRIHWHQWSEKL